MGIVEQNAGPERYRAAMITKQVAPFPQVLLVLLQSHPRVTFSCAVRPARIATSPLKLPQTVITVDLHARG